MSKVKSNMNKFNMYLVVMARVWKKLGSSGDGYTRILECRVLVCRVLKKVGFGRVISGSGIPGLITNIGLLVYSLRLLGSKS